MNLWKFILVFALFLGLGLIFTNLMWLGILLFVGALVILMTSAMFNNAKGMDEWVNRQ